MNDDQISRQAAKLKVAKVIWEDGDSCYDFIDKCVDSLDDVPPAQPERKKGCKIVKGTGHYGYCACDQCGKPVHPEDRFCSKCGADFREDTDVERKEG